MLFRQSVQTVAHAMELFDFVQNLLRRHRILAFPGTLPLMFRCTSREIHGHLEPP
jgi:hypothetical protein